MATKKAADGKRKRKPAKAKWDLRLYVAGQTPGPAGALDSLKKLCEEHRAEQYNIEITE